MAPYGLLFGNTPRDIAEILLKLALNTINQIKCLETDMITIPHPNSNLYSVQKFIVFKIQKDLSTRSEVVAREQFCLQTDDGKDSAM